MEAVVAARLVVVALVEVELVTAKLETISLFHTLSHLRLMEEPSLKAVSPQSSWPEATVEEPVPPWGTVI